MDYLYPAARADEDEVDASSGASSRAPSTSKQSWTKCATPTMLRCHMNSCSRTHASRTCRTCTCRGFLFSYLGFLAVRIRMLSARAIYKPVLIAKQYDCGIASESSSAVPRGTAPQLAWLAQAHLPTHPTHRMLCQQACRTAWRAEEKSKLDSALCSNSWDQVHRPGSCRERVGQRLRGRYVCCSCERRWVHVHLAMV